MKILKVKIQRAQGGGKTHYTYPPEYDAKKIQVICYESVLPENYAEVVARGNTDEYLIGAVKDADAAQFLQSADVEELSRNNAVSLGKKWVKQREKITDPEKVLAILAKAARKEDLTQDEKNAIDPKHSESGVNMSKSFEDKLDILEAKLGSG